MFPRPAAPIFCSVSIVSEAREVREFFGGILGLGRPSGPWCFPVRQRRFSVLLYRVSEETLESFFVGFSDWFVLQGHGGSHCFSVRQRRFSVPFLGLQMRRWRVFWWDSRTSSSFRAMVFPRPAAPIFCSVSIVSEAREVREFFGGILGLVRPSGPWCFPVRQRRFSVLFLGFQKRRYREFVGGILGLVRPCRAMVFPRPAAPIFCVCAQQQQQLLQGFRSDVTGFFGGILGLVQSAMVFPRPAAPIFCFVSRVSEATLEGFSPPAR